jgi:hypothetical protein
MDDLGRLMGLARLTRDEVCALARYGPQTLARRIAAGRMPAPVDRARQAIFDGPAVRRALRLGESAAPAEEEPITIDVEAFRAALKERRRHGSARGGRHRPSAAVPRDIVASRLSAASTVDLGRYVTVRRRADGTCRVYFQVPTRLRPPGWPSLISLPDGQRGGVDLRDANQVAMIRAEGSVLYARLREARTLRTHELDPLQ